MEQLYIDNKTFEKMNFKENPLQLAQYENCIFNNCDFSNTNLSEMKFIECSFTDCNLSLAKLQKLRYVI